MTAPTLDQDVEYFDLPMPHPMQAEVLDAPHRFKVDRKGRRAGKTRGAFVAAMIGHGPGWRDGTPMHEGVGQGWDVVWLVPDYPQGKAVWEEDIKPAAQDLVGAHVTESPFPTLSVHGAGSLHVRSAENIRSIRGLGKRLKGIVIDEAAWMDLKGHWRDVIRPILMDNHGWAIIQSTTNAGLDGNTDHRTPSFFNLLCLEIQLGKGESPAIAVEGLQLIPRDPAEWAEFYGTAEGNPYISPSEFAGLVSEYPEGSVSLSQEVYAKLLTAGAGVAFPEWRDDHHIQKYEPPPGWRWFAGMDWGYSSRCAVYLMAAGPNGDILVRHELYLQKKTPYDVGFLLGQKARGLPEPLEFIAAGSDMWDVRDGGPTLAENCQAGLIDAAQGGPVVPLISVARGSGSRAARKMLLHQALKFEKLPDGRIPSWAGAKLRVHPSCANLLRTLPALPIDPKNTEDVDEKAEDHPYDALTYGLDARVPHPEREPVGRVPDDIHPGIDPVLRRRKPRWETPEEEADHRLAEMQSAGHYTGVRYGGARPVDDE